MLRRISVLSVFVAVPTVGYATTVAAAEEAPAKKKTVLITGGSGLLGQALTSELLKRGHEVRHLSRTKKEGASPPVFTWDVGARRVEAGALDGVDAVVHLAGTSLNHGRWTPKLKEEFISSRVDTADMLTAAARERTGAPKPITMVCANAIGWYGFGTTSAVHTEGEAAADDYVGQLCKAWQDAAVRFGQETGGRVCTMRIGVVLSGSGGALQEMARPAKFGVGAALGDGSQWMPWVHVHDAARAFVRAIEDDSMEGPYNLVAPEHATNEQITAAIIEKVSPIRAILPNVPAFAANILLGEFSKMVLEGSRVSCDKLRKAGFEFQFPTVASALDDIYGRK